MTPFPQLGRSAEEAARDLQQGVEFLLVYIREAHAIDSRSPSSFEFVEDPITVLERQAVASTCVEKLNLDMIPAVIDRLDDKVNSAYKGWPDRLYLVGVDGKLAYSGGRGPFGFKPDELEDAIKAELTKNAKKSEGDKGSNGK